MIIVIMIMVVVIVAMMMIVMMMLMMMIMMSFSIPDGNNTCRLLFSQGLAILFLVLIEIVLC